jgi:serine protease Do
MKPFARLRTLFLVSALAVPLSCARTQHASPARTEATPEPPPRVPVTVLPAPAFAKTGAGSVSIADVAERALPSVVNISLTKLARAHAPTPFPWFFGPGFGPEGGERREQGMGSGVIVSNDGYILTNNHVVSNAQEIRVTLSDRREFDAEVVGTDPKSDVAVIRLKSSPTDLPPIQIGDSSALRLGDVVLAIGNPFGVGQTVTMGIVSAKGRADVGIVDYEDFIQTDAAINPGNSGGALVDTQGRLVGINTAILSRSGGYQGIGFAIPTNMAIPIMESLKKYGKVTRGWLGVSIQDLDQEIAQAMKLPTSNGVLVSDVQPGSPASKAGLKRGDVIVKVDGLNVSSTGELRNAIASAGANRKVSLDLLRDGKPLVLTASLGESASTDTGPRSSTGGARPSDSTLEGLGVAELGADTRRAFEIDDSVKGGVVVTRVLPGTPVQRAGLRPGDVILEVNRRPVASIKELGAELGKTKGSVLMLIHRGQSTVFVVVKR